ncbi:hypothetical protein FNV67_00820 (plasmid) [Streptomyces sp. S1D4-20]|nr:hypothetical protein FNV67_00820 [Streptomyces sp. S1D4-20]
MPPGRTGPPPWPGRRQRRSATPRHPQAAPPGRRSPRQPLWHAARRRRPGGRPGHRVHHPYQPHHEVYGGTR